MQWSNLHAQAKIVFQTAELLLQKTNRKKKTVKERVSSIHVHVSAELHSIQKPG